MAYDSSAPSDYETCPRCAYPILSDQSTTLVHFPNGITRRLHAECAKTPDDALARLEQLAERLRKMWR